MKLFGLCTPATVLTVLISLSTQVAGETNEAGCYMLDLTDDIRKLDNLFTGNSASTHKLESFYCIKNENN